MPWGTEAQLALRHILDVPWSWGKTIEAGTGMARFLEVQPTIENQWRALILFGRNVASYKFALGKALLDLRRQPGDLIKLEDLAVPFADNIRAHLRGAPKQATSRSSRFLDACQKANDGAISPEELRKLTISIGFNNVIDAFHRLGPADIPTRFYIDERQANGGIRLTDELRRLTEVLHPDDLLEEAEARWRLVETAWELGVNQSLIEFDTTSENLIAVRRDGRVTVTSSRAALNGYQKGHCFYCFAPISIEGGPAQADVDHFLPWAARIHIDGNVNGIWNLVLSCRDCNRGVGGKSSFVPSLKLLERLHTRNEFLITSHHPLRETLMRQTGLDEPSRVGFLQRNWSAALSALIARWEPVELAPVAF